MSAICALVAPVVDSRAGVVNGADLDLMLAALAHRGVDGSGSWHRGQVALGHQALHTTPESRSGQQPLYREGAGLAITADVRLDNRPELFKRLGIPTGEAAAWSDARLILTAYEKWGLGCPRHLVGAFAFVLWDGRKRRLIGCRDALGLRPLFYARHQGLLAFASEAKAICAIQGGGRLNRRAIARLACPLPKRESAVETFFDGIRGLPAATLMVVDADGERQQTYWQPDPSARLDLKSDDAILEALRELLFEVIGSQLRSAGPVASLLSGGLDSSSIVAVAARLLQGQGQTLTTLSSVSSTADPSAAQSSASFKAPSTTGQVKDERSYIELFRDWPNIDQHYLCPPGAGPLDDIERLVQAFESPALTTRHYLYAAFAEAASESGIRVILDGCGGEMGLTWRADGLMTEWLFQGAWPRLWRELHRGAARRGTSPWSLVRSQLLRPLVPAAIRRYRASSPINSEHVLTPAFLSAELGASPERRCRYSEAASKLGWSHRDNQALAMRGLPSRLAGTAGYERIEMRYPLMDRRLLEFCLAAPAQLKVRDGYSRYLARGALDGVLPAAIQWRTTKEPFSPDYFLRYNAQRPRAAAILAAIGPRDPVREVVDVDKLKTWSRYEMTSSRYHSATNWAAGHGVPHGLYLIAFLRQFSEFRA